MSGSSGKRRRGESSQASEVREAMEKRQRLSEEIRTEVAARVETTDAAELLDEQYNRWELDARHATPEDFTRLALANFGVSPDADIPLGPGNSDFGIRRLDEVAERMEQEALALYHAVRLSDPEGEHPEALRKATKIIEMVYYAKRVVLSAFQARLAVHQLHCADLQLAPDLDMQLGAWSVRFRWIDLSGSTPLQKLLLHLLDVAMEKRYRKHEGYVYEPIVVNGHETHAWRQVCDIKEFVYAAAKKEVHWEQWSNLTANGNNAKQAVEFLTNTNDYQFPFLRKDRSVFAFRNGVYLARDDRFHRFGADEPLSDAVVAARFFDADFDPHDGAGDWRDIPTPHLQSIMDFQEWPADVCDWLYVALGRLLYNVNERDGWQVIPFMLGSASSGKSTIVLKVAKAFYEHADVGVLSNNIEKQFGISALHGKLLFCGPEVKGDLRIEQAEFQSIVSGESVSVSAKFKTAHSVDQWTTPGIMAGNEVPAFSDNAGSVQRRFLVFAFNKTVTNGDMRLGDKLAEEMPAILVKCNRAYLEASGRYGGRNVWTVLPQYFHNTRNEMAEAVNGVEGFLKSSEVVLGAELYCPFGDFKAAWRAFCVGNGYVLKGPVTNNTFRAPFQKYGLDIVSGPRVYRGVTRNVQWLVGLDLAVGDGGALLG